MTFGRMGVMLNILFSEAIQTVASDSSNWMALVGNLVNIGFSAVVGWYLLTKALPEMQKDFRAELQLQRIETSTREKGRIDADREALKMVIDHCEREAIRSAQLLKEEISNNSKVIEDTRNVLEEVRDALHEIKDVVRISQHNRHTT